MIFVFARLQFISVRFIVIDVIVIGEFWRLNGICSHHANHRDNQENQNSPTIHCHRHCTSFRKREDSFWNRNGLCDIVIYLSVVAGENNLCKLKLSYFSLFSAVNSWQLLQTLLIPSVFLFQRSAHPFI